MLQLADARLLRSIEALLRYAWSSFRFGLDRVNSTPPESPLRHRLLSRYQPCSGVHAPMRQACLGTARGGPSVGAKVIEGGRGPGGWVYGYSPLKFFHLFPLGTVFSYRWLKLCYTAGVMQLLTLVLGVVAILFGVALMLISDPGGDLNGWLGVLSTALGFTLISTHDSMRERR